MKLQYPITVGEQKIDALTFRRPRAKDMVVLGDHLSTLTSLDPEKPQLAMTSATVTATIALVGVLSDIGEEAAGLLDFADLTVAAGEAMATLGEPEGSAGEAPTGE